jgi:hypothetical protein
MRTPFAADISHSAAIVSKHINKMPMQTPVITPMKKWMSIISP